METVIDPIDVMCVKAIGGTKGAREAFDVLESRLPTPIGRRFYGAYDPLTREYGACVATVRGEDAYSLGLENRTIMGGKYVTQKVVDWDSKIQQLPQMFMEMARGREADPGRPSVEHYKSQHLSTDSGLGEFQHSKLCWHPGDRTLNRARIIQWAFWAFLNASSTSFKATISSPKVSGLLRHASKARCTIIPLRP